MLQPVVKVAAVSSASGLGKDRLHCTRLPRYSPAPVSMELTIHSLGPTAKMNASRMKASHRLITESRRMPLSIPAITLYRAIPVITMMMIDWVSELLGIPVTWVRPLLIWSVPRPSEVARPKMVPKTARMSTMWPGQPNARSPSSG